MFVEKQITQKITYRTTARVVCAARTMKPVLNKTDHKQRISSHRKNIEIKKRGKRASFFWGI
jgi:hypothetical protein